MTQNHGETRDDSLHALEPEHLKPPGAVVIFAAGKPASFAFEVPARGLDIGRGSPSGLFADDERASRRHARLARRDGQFEVTDLESRNGTAVDGRALTRGAVASPAQLVRIGRSLLWLVDDVGPFLRSLVRAEPDTPVLGGRTRRAWGDIALVSRAGDTLCLRGETGSGKELAARAFHEARFGSGASAPFVAVNCAAIPQGLAERLLFGTRRGAFSGATSDAAGYVQAADGGTLFLDEIAELDPLVQAKLLRVLESREVMPLGATQPRRVQVSVCCASHRALRDEVAAGRFREDLYFRIGRPEVELPPLRQRLDELPFLIARELASVDAALSASVAFVEACALRTWPGNVRELLVEVRRAGHAALQESTALVDAQHLAADAGVALAGQAGEAEARDKSAPPPSDEEIVRTLREQAGNVRGTARALGMHRNQLRRWLDKHPEVLGELADKSSDRGDDEG